MTPDELSFALRATPFEPFTIRMGDGSTYEVPDPGYIAYPGRYRTAAIVDAKGVIHVVDVRLITELIFDLTATRTFR